MRPSFYTLRTAIVLVVSYLGGWSIVAQAVAAEPRDSFVISIVDEETGRGIPLVVLRTTSNVEYIKR